MKLSASQLRRIIKEELQKSLPETLPMDEGFGDMMKSFFGKGGKGDTPEPEPEVDSSWDSPYIEDKVEMLKSLSPNERDKAGKALPPEELKSLLKRLEIDWNRAPDAELSDLMDLMLDVAGVARGPQRDSLYIGQKQQIIKAVRGRGRIGNINQIVSDMAAEGHGAEYFLHPPHSGLGLSK